MCAAVLLAGVWTTSAQAVATLPGSPFWQGQRVEGESAFFEVERGKPTATVHLLFAPSAVKSVTSSDGSVRYEEGRDYAQVVLSLFE